MEGYMKKIFIVLLIFICGCETTQTTIQSETEKPTKITRNPKCEDIKAFKVFQVVDTYVLAFVCEEKSYNDCSLGHAVYFNKEKDKIYFDDQIIKVKSNECAIYTGTFQYQLQSGFIRTVPIVKIIDSHSNTK
jgi:hypothetical protein